MASRTPDSAAIRATRGPELLFEPPWSATATESIFWAVAGEGETSVVGLGDGAVPAAAAGGGDGLFGFGDAEAEDLADGDGVGEAFLAAVADTDGLGDALAAAVGGATGAGAGAGAGAGGGGGGGGGASEPPHMAPGDDWLLATCGEAGGTEVRGLELPPNSTVANT